MLLSPILSATVTTRIVESTPDISPSLEKQLVLELKTRIKRSKLIQRHPGSFSSRLALPLNQQFRYAPSKAAL